MTDLKVVDREQTAVQEKVADPLDLILKNHSLVSSTLSKEALMKIEQRMPEIMRATNTACLLYTSPSPRDQRGSRMPSSA